MRKATGRPLRLYVLGLVLVRRRPLADAKMPPLARPPRNGGSPLSAGIPRPELRKGLRAYRSDASREAAPLRSAAFGCQCARPMAPGNGTRETENVKWKTGHVERIMFNVERLPECKDAVYRRLYVSCIKSSYG